MLVDNLKIVMSMDWFQRKLTGTPSKNHWKSCGFMSSFLENPSMDGGFRRYPGNQNPVMKIDFEDHPWAKAHRYVYVY